MAQFLFESGTALHIRVTFITNLAMYGKVGPLLQRVRKLVGSNLWPYIPWTLSLQRSSKSMDW